jgi:NAD(P)-dependent dehydrogenase (short-subunit alcohol dehydrogenase family)
VIVTARNQPDEAESPYQFIAADLSRPEDVIQLAEEITAQFGGVDILINNMGANIFREVALVH